MIIKTLHVVCDHDGCGRWHEGDKGESRALPLVRKIRALGWVASDGRQYCPQHGGDAEVGVSYRTVKGALLGPGSGIETAEQAEQVVRTLRGLPTGPPPLGFADDLPAPTIRETIRGIRDAITGKRDDADRCGACAVCQPDWRGMYVCATCGNKRCPHATDCRHACTGSNERGGSMLGFADDPSTPTIRETVRGIRDAITGARPCCHTTGPNHHPACQESK